MSHKATNWAVQQRGLKPAVKIVLWHLADRHHPDHGCFPSQKTLAADCEVSRASLNTYLATLEKAKLIRRVTSVDPLTRRQRPTRYKLAFEADFNETEAAEDQPSRVQDMDTEPCPKTTEAVSKKDAEPCPENAESRVQILDTNSVREPIRRDPVNSNRAREEDRFEVFWERYPHRVARASAKQAFERAVTKVSLNEILVAVDRYIETKPSSRQWVNPTRWLEEERWRDQPATVDTFSQFLKRKMKELDERASGDHRGPTIDGGVCRADTPSQKGPPLAKSMQGPEFEAAARPKTVRPCKPTAFQQDSPHLYPEIFG